ncbi:MAG: peptidylprolyl isomerase, partial [Paludibacteraceae bacterium]|nr:peptidylprolyl isomerase [Paludibacteraceae bacterium]
FKGNVVPLIDSEGNQLNAEVVEVKKESITVDFNHPLAGEVLHFVGEILDIHEATEADSARFGMHQCGGCGCSGSDCGDCGCDSGCSCH